MIYYVYNSCKSVVICIPKLSDHFSHSMAQVAQVEPTKVRAATFSKPEYEAHLTRTGWSLKLVGSNLEVSFRMFQTYLQYKYCIADTCSASIVLLTSEGKQNGHCFLTISMNPMASSDVRSRSGIPCPRPFCLRLQQVGSIVEFYSTTAGH